MAATLTARLRAFRSTPLVRQLIWLGKNVLFLRMVAARAWTLAQPRLRRGDIRLSDLTVTVDPAELPPLDRDGAAAAARSERQRQWAEQGYLILEGALPESLVDEYVELRASLPEGLDHEAYIQVPKMRELALHREIVSTLEELFGEEMGLSLSLSNWTSTERNWHQDEYLNPPHVRAHYAAAWMALEDISPESGPFELVPASHRWGLMDRARVQRFLTLKEIRSPHWPKLSESILDDVYGRLIEERGAKPKQFLGRKGDVLIWHACLAHRGSVPRDRTVQRRALICHYTAVSKGTSYYPKVGSVPSSGGKFFYYDAYEQAQPALS
jgi:hypothetical protein